jgi:dGTPase
VRLLTEEREIQMLSPYAAKAAESAGRVVDEEHDPVRTAFQRDRDRVLHSKPFRRLKHKTQVFIDPYGDHYRTRLTHSLEVAQIARTIGRALRLNEDLIEAIALGHDVGHTPFGHSGEEALDQALQEHRAQVGTAYEGPDRFRHHEQSLRILDVLERLNLTQETRAGIGGHSKGRNDLSAYDGEPTSTLEAAVVRVSDRIAYMSHDLDDAVRSGIIREVPAQFDRLGANQSDRIGTMVEDAIANSLDKPAVVLSPWLMHLMNDLKEWLFENVYLHYPRLYPDIPKAQALVRDLFHHFVQPGHLPEGYDGAQGAVDYLAGMTDRFAIETFTHLRLPSGFRD